MHVCLFWQHLMSVPEYLTLQTGEEASPTVGVQTWRWAAGAAFCWLIYRMRALRWVVFASWGRSVVERKHQLLGLNMCIGCHTCYTTSSVVSFVLGVLCTDLETEQWLYINPSHFGKYISSKMHNWKQIKHESLSNIKETSCQCQQLYPVCSLVLPHVSGPGQVSFYPLLQRKPHIVIPVQVLPFPLPQLGLVVPIQKAPQFLDAAGTQTRMVTISFQQPERINNERLTLKYFCTSWNDWVISSTSSPSVFIFARREEEEEVKSSFSSRSIVYNDWTRLKGAPKSVFFLAPLSLGSDCLCLGLANFCILALLHTSQRVCCLWKTVFTD